MEKKVDYPYIRKYCSLMGSKQYYVAREIEKARSENAPQTAYASRHGGGWYTVDTTDPQLAERLGYTGGKK